MFRFATLQSSVTAEDRVQLIAAVLKDAGVDIFCCHGEFGEPVGDYQSTRIIADLLGMSYFFSTTRPEGYRDGHCSDVKASGLAILSGSQAWMLNSGTFPLPSGECGARRIVQFAVIRKQGNTILVLNISFSPDPDLQEQQLETVLANQLLRDHYGAIFLCADIHHEVMEKRLYRCKSASRLTSLHDVTVIDPDSSGERVQRSKHGQAGIAMLLITNREKPIASVEVGSSRELLLPQQGIALHLGFTTDFTLKRLPLEKKNGRYRLLSFREQWNIDREGELVRANRVAAGY